MAYSKKNSLLLYKKKKKKKIKHLENLLIFFFLFGRNILGYRELGIAFLVSLGPSTYIYHHTLHTLFSLSYNTRERQHHTLAASLSFSRSLFQVRFLPSIFHLSYRFLTYFLCSYSDRYLFFSSHFFSLRFASDLNCFCVYFILFLLDLISD